MGSSILSATPNQLPTLAGGNPLLGHLVDFQMDPVAMLARGVNELGDIYQFRIGHRKFVLFCGLSAHDAFFQASEDELDAKSVYQFTIPIFGKGVAYDVSSELMTEQMGFLFPALRESSMNRFANTMFEEISIYLESLGESGTLNLPVAMNELTVNIASRCFLGEEVRSEVDTGFAAAYHELQNGINTIGFFLPNLPTSAHRARDRARLKIASIFKRIMDQRRKNGSNADDFMQILMGSCYKDGRSLSNEEVIGLLITTLFAGQHTSAVLATWTGLEMLRDVDYVDKVRDETQEIYATRKYLDYAGLKQQLVLERAVRECERLHPPLILLLRRVISSFEFKGMKIPAGAFAMVSPAVSHRLHDVFVDPERFNPDRFSPPHGEDKQHQHTLIGFGGGKHRCMGKNFAVMQIKAIWSVLLDQFDFELETPFPGPNYGSWVTGPEEPCMVRYRRRTSRTLNPC